MFLNTQDFSSVIKNTPLISIDLIVKNSEGKVLLGKRVNEPAQGFYFVPGGRIFKDETLDAAFERTVKEELGLTLKKDEANFYGLYEHFYDNNVFNTDFSTHYIVLAHEIIISTLPACNVQHSNYNFFSVAELLERDDVHQHTKEYFLKGNN